MNLRTNGLLISDRLYISRLGIFTAYSYKSNTFYTPQNDLQQICNVIKNSEVRNLSYNKRTEWKIIAKIAAWWLWGSVLTTTTYDEDMSQENPWTIFI